MTKWVCLGCRRDRGRQIDFFSCGKCYSQLPPVCADCETRMDLAADNRQDCPGCGHDCGTAKVAAVAEPGR